MTDFRGADMQAAADAARIADLRAQLAAMTERAEAAEHDIDNLRASLNGEANARLDAEARATALTGLLKRALEALGPFDRYAQGLSPDYNSRHDKTAAFAVGDYRTARSVAQDIRTLLGEKS